MDAKRCRDEDGSLARRLLEAGVPLSLLLDLVSPHGPDSRGILDAERAGRR